MHLWDHQNPHGTVSRKPQRKFSANVWCGIINDNLLGTVFLPSSINGRSYLNILKNDLPSLTQDVP